MAGEPSWLAWTWLVVVCGFSVGAVKKEGSGCQRAGAHDAISGAFISSVAGRVRL